MKISDVSAGVGRLHDATDNLNRAWSETRVRWNDPVSRSLEEEHLVPLLSEVEGAFTAIEQLTDALRQLERECGPWQ